jgi:hypothetical protein
MPSAASITVKKADEATDIVYDTVAPASGDGNFAQWRQDTGAAAAFPLGHRAVLGMMTKWNGPRTARRVVLRYSRPYSVLNTTTNRYENTDQVVAELVMTVPQAIPSADINEAVYQFLNLLGKTSGLIKSAAAGGFAPT